MFKYITFCCCKKVVIFASNIRETHDFYRKSCCDGYPQIWYIWTTNLSDKISHAAGCGKHRILSGLTRASGLTMLPHLFWPVSITSLFRLPGIFHTLLRLNNNLSPAAFFKSSLSLWRNSWIIWNTSSCLPVSSLLCLVRRAGRLARYSVGLSHIWR